MARSLVTPSSFDVDRIRADFPILARTVHGHPLVYLDNAATTQKPNAVIEAVDRYYREQNANIHRGVHHLSEQATQAYEAVRGKVRDFIGAEDAREIVFVRGTTEAINLVAQSYGRPRLGPGDEIVVTQLEHHSNIVPWQLLCEQTGALLRVAPIDAHGAVEETAFRDLLGPRTRIVALAHVSNALGTVNPVATFAAAAHDVGAVVVVDGAQAVAHAPVDVRALGCDFYAASGHKMFGPTGIGFLYGRLDLLESMPPYQGGGDMIATVSFEGTTWNRVPHKFEAGTPHIAGVLGLGAAIDYLAAIDMQALQRHEHALVEEATQRLQEIAGVRLVGTAPAKTGIVGFVLEGTHAHDVGTILDQQGIAIRAGHHCAQPVMERFGVPATVRASFAMYNTREDVHALVRGVTKVKEIFG